MTLAEIAKAAQVSIGTVDRVIHNRGNVAEITRAKVESIIAEHGYSPNVLASQLKKKKKFVIGVLLPEEGYSDGYWEQIYCGIKIATKILYPFNIELIRMPFTRMLENDLYNKGLELINRGIESLITAPVNPQEFEKLIPLLDEIPYVFVDTPLSSAEPLFSIVQNPYQGGRCAGRIMKNLKGSGLFVCIKMFANAYNLQERGRGFKEFLMQDSASQVIECLCNSTKHKEVYEYIDKLLAKNPEIKGFFVPHAEVHILAQYFVEKNLRDKVALIGYDLLEKNKAGLQEGLIDCIIGQRPMFQGMNAVCGLHSAVNLNQEITGNINVPIDIYYQENIVQEAPVSFPLQIVNY